MTDADAPEPEPPDESGRAHRARQRKQVLLRLDPAIYEALARWAGEELRSTNAQIDFLLRRALRDAGRLPKEARPPPRRGRPPRDSPVEQERHQHPERRQDQRREDLRREGRDGQEGEAGQGEDE